MVVTNPPPLDFFSWVQKCSLRSSLQADTLPLSCVAGYASIETKEKHYLLSYVLFWCQPAWIKYLGLCNYWVWPWSKLFTKVIMCLWSSPRVSNFTARKVMPNNLSSDALRLDTLLQFLVKPVAVCQSAWIQMRFWVTLCSIQGQYGAFAGATILPILCQPG